MPRDFDEFDTVDEVDIGRQVDERVRGLVGTLVDAALLDYLEYEEEFDTFEPIRRRR